MDGEESFMFMADTLNNSIGDASKTKTTAFHHQ